MDVRDHSLCWISWQARHGRPVRVGVVGDLILDEYLEGQVDRISPEAPVAVHLVTSTEHSAGGAANVARNIKLAGGEPVLLGILGRDEAGERLRAILAQDGIDTSTIRTVADRPTTKKTRVTANHQQLVRIDRERVEDIGADDRDAILASLKAARLEAIVLSDYGKGMLADSLIRDVLSHAKANGIRAVVDPKGTDYGRYRDAYLVTPNHKEAVMALGAAGAAEWAPDRLARELRSKYGIANVLVTLGPKGMMFVSAENPDDYLHLPADAREVYDVSGAGDTVVAMMALALGAGDDIGSAMVMANIAAGRVVEKWGTQPITRAELEARMVRRSRPALGGRPRCFATVAELAAEIGETDRVVLALLDFERFDEDILDCLEAAAELGGTLVVRLAPRPNETAGQFERKVRLVSALACVPYVLTDPARNVASRLGDSFDTDVVSLTGGQVVRVEPPVHMRAKAPHGTVRETR